MTATFGGQGEAGAVTLVGNNSCEFTPVLGDQIELHILISIDRMGCLLQYVGIFPDIRVCRVNDMRGMIGVRKQIKQNSVCLNDMCIAYASAFEQIFFLFEYLRNLIA